MVKKILHDGSPCGKCAQAEALLRKRGYWNHIDSVVFAYEDDPQSDGMILAAQYEIDLAPFFVVQGDDGTERVYTRVLEFIKKELESTGAVMTSASDIKPASLLAEAQKQYGKDFAIAFSGAEDVVLIDMAAKNALPYRVFCLDTGRLHEETYKYLEEVRKHYGVELEIYSPVPKLLEPFVRENGLHSFYRDGHKECCGIRKVEPLSRALQGRKAWATGQRRDQSPATRSGLSHIEIDSDHPDENGNPIRKYNPLLDWSSADVWDYIRRESVPYNRLHDQGFRSIGCEPCTRPSRPGEHERAARWWWESETQRECGLHRRD